MKYWKLLSLLLIFNLVIAISFCSAQKLEIVMDENVISPGDSLYFTANYTAAPGNDNPATLLMMAIDDSFRIWEKRFPLLGEPIKVSVYVPVNMPKGNYRLRFEVMQNFFSFTGKVQSPGDLKSLQATLVTNDGSYLQKDLTVLPDSTFTFTNVLFADDALLSFTNKKVNRDLIDIAAIRVLDSTVKNINPVNKFIYIGQKNKANIKILQNEVGTKPLDYFDQTHMLEVVRVVTNTKTPAQKFNEEYSTGVFRAQDERLYDMMNVSTGYFNVLQYLQGRVAGMMVNSFTGVAIWRGQRVQFYVDEFRADMSLVQMIPVADIAIVKAYPPPFFGNLGGSGGAVAIYTRRGRSFENTGNNTFRVYGYTPLRSAFSAEPSR